MARPVRTIAQVKKTLHIPADLEARMILELYSDIEGRVPHGAQSALIVRLLREHFARLDAQVVLPASPQQL